MRRRSKKYLFVLSFLLFLSSYTLSSFSFAYFREVYFRDFFNIIKKFMYADDISCYEANGSFTNLFYAPNSIYFYQTTCHKTITLYEACSVEAVARLHPSQTVYIIFLSIVPLSDPVIKKLLKIKNVKVSRIDINNYAEGTPIDDLPAIIAREKRKYKAMADLLKIITLYKYGGTVLDLDIIVAKRLNRLGENWLVKEDGFSLSMLRLSNDVIGRAAAGMILSNFQTKMDRGYMNLKNAIKDTFEELCSASNIKNMNNDTCSGYRFYNGKLLHPISYEQRDQYLSPGFPEDSNAYQTWLEDIKIIPKDSLYTALARTYCPQIFTAFMYEFRALKHITIQEIPIGRAIDKTNDTNNNQHRSNVTLAADILQRMEFSVNDKPKDSMVVPNNSVQFMAEWKYLKGSDRARGDYLSIIPPSKLPSIFENALESDVLSDVLRTIHNNMDKYKYTVAAYLRNLCKVKRFSALAMFLSATDKELINNMLKHCRAVENLSESEITDLMNKYEL